MIIELYKNSSDNKVVSKELTNKIEMNGVLRESTSLISPSLLISLDNTTLANVVEHNNIQVLNDDLVNVMYQIKNGILESNYIYIPDFNRYYYINNIISVRQDMFRIDCQVDVLMSYQKEIRNTKAFVMRNEFEYDPLVKDDEVTYYYDKDVIEYVPEKGDKVNNSFTPNLPNNSHNIVISVINNLIGRVYGGSAQPPVSSLPTPTSSSTGAFATSQSYIINYEMLTRLSKRLNGNNSNLTSFVLSIIVFPFTLKTTGLPDTLRLGSTDLTNTSDDENDKVEVIDLEHGTPQYIVIADFTIAGDNFMDYEPYSHYEIYLPYLGWISLSAVNVLNNRLIVYYVADYQTGSTQVCIYDVTNSKIIYTSNAQLGVKVGITTTSQKEVNDNRNSNNIGLGVGLITSALSVGGGVATSNPIAIMGGLISGGSTIAKYVQNQNTNYARASGSVSSGQSGLYLPQEVKIRKTTYKPKGYDVEYFKLKGRPLNQVKKLGDLTGYTLVGDEHLENFGSSTQSETEEIKSILNEGVIL